MTLATRIDECETLATASEFVSDKLVNSELTFEFALRTLENYIAMGWYFL